MLFTVFFNQSLNSTLIEALMVSTSNYEMRDSLFLGIDASFNLKFRIAVYPRSSIYKTGMILSNSVGIVDEGYTDEISVVFYHVMPNMPRYRVGDRVCQIAVESRKASQCFREVDELKVMDRGSNGYGSTGLKGM